MLIISFMGNLAFSDSFFPVPYLLVSLSWRRFRAWLRHMVHHLHFVPSCLDGGIRRSWWRGNIFISSTRICNRHFLTWKIKILPPVTFPATPLSFFFSNPEHLQPPESADRSHQRPRDQLFILYVGICILYPAAHETTIYLLTPLADSIPGFCDLGASYARALSKRCYGFTRTRAQIDLMPSINVKPCVNPTRLGLESKLPIFRSFKQSKTGALFDGI